MRLSRADVLALLIALGAAIAGLVVWMNGTVTLGMTLGFDGERVRAVDVTPGGNAHRNEWHPGVSVLDVTTVDGAPVDRGESIGSMLSGSALDDVYVWEEVYSSQGSPMGTIGPEHRLPIEAVPATRIETAIAGEIDPECCFGVFATIDRGYLEYRLYQSIWIVLVGLLVGGVVWRLLVHGVAGDLGRGHAVTIGAALASPFLILPAVQVGTPAGIAAGYLVPTAAALNLGLGLARHHPDRQWEQTASAASVVAAALTGVIVVRSLTSPALTDDRLMIVLLIAAVGVIPALVAGAAPERSNRERTALATLGLMPAAAATLLLPESFDPMLPVTLVGLLVGAQLLPVGRGLALVGRGISRMRSRAMVTGAPTSDPSVAATRDLLTYGLIGVSTLTSLAMPEGGPIGDLYFVGGWAIVVGVALATLVGFAIRRGFLGDGWTDAAVPLAAAVGVPVMLASGLSYPGSTPIAVVPTALAALSVAHVLAARHADAALGGRLFVGSASVVGVITLLSLVGEERIATVLIGLVALIPGMTAFAADVGEPRGLTSRLETLAVALTPGFGATMLFPPAGLLLLSAWLVAVFVWRQFTLNPLLGMAQRTQLQRDVAVAAAETERARLAADLHDDALQQLTMLVRALDEKGQKVEADEAREIATKLRSVVGDLRLPILDDLGAGAALEWLVERVEPLAGGPVKLERSDETRPPANVELAVFRVAQEALTNAIKHGKPPIAVRYDVRADGRVTLAIDDAGDGIGSEAAEEAPKAGHFGLVNMQQRAEQIGALLDVRRWPAGGTRVALEWRPQ